MIPFALAKIGHQYLLFGAAGLICLVAFVTLILSPALSAHGRLWEKAAAGFLSIFVLAALLVCGVVIGLVIVYYYTDITNFSWRAGIIMPRLKSRRPARASSTRFRKRSSRAPACPRWRARRHGCSTPASP